MSGSSGEKINTANKTETHAGNDVEHTCAKLHVLAHLFLQREVLPAHNTTRAHTHTQIHTYGACKNQTDTHAGKTECLPEQ